MLKEPLKVKTEDGYTFSKQSDGSYSDGDLSYDSYEDFKNRCDTERIEWVVLEGGSGLKHIGSTGGDNGTDKLPVYLLGDQPTTCPQCGARTDFKEIPQEDGHIVELHTCLGCGFIFYAEL